MDKDDINNTTSKRDPLEGEVMIKKLLAYLRIEAVDRLTVVTTAVITFCLLITFMTAALVCLNSALSVWIGGMIGSEVGGYLIMMCFCCLLACIVWLKRKALFENMLVPVITKFVYDLDGDKKVNEEDTSGIDNSNSTESMLRQGEEKRPAKNESTKKTEVIDLTDADFLTKDYTSTED